MKLKKWEFIIIFIILLVAVGIGWAIDETVTVSMTPKALTAANYGAFNKGLVCVEGNAIRFTLDGVTTPTSGSSGVGIKLDIGQCIELTTNDQLVKFRAIRNSATDATIRCTYW